MEKLTASQKGRRNPDKAFKDDEKMRIYKVFDQVKHTSISTWYWRFSILFFLFRVRLYITESIRRHCLSGKSRSEVAIKT